MKQETRRHKAKVQSSPLKALPNLQSQSAQALPPFTNAIWRCSRRFQQPGGLVFADKTSRSGTETSKETWETFGKRVASRLVQTLKSWRWGRNVLYGEPETIQGVQSLGHCCFCCGRSAFNPRGKQPLQLYYQGLIHLSMMSSPKHCTLLNMSLPLDWPTNQQNIK